MTGITYEQFEKTMQHIVSFFEFGDKVSDAFYDMGCEIQLPNLVDDVLDLLTAVLHDKEEWIAFWVFELDCGKKYKEGMITDAEGRNIKLQTIKNLWDVVVYHSTEQ